MKPSITLAPGRGARWVFLELRFDPALLTLSADADGQFCCFYRRPTSSTGVWTLFCGAEPAPDAVAQPLNAGCIYRRETMRRRKNFTQDSLQTEELMGRTMDEMLESLTPAQRTAVERRTDELIAKQRLEAMLLEGLSSEESVLTSEDWVSIREEALARLQRKRQP